MTDGNPTHYCIIITLSTLIVVSGAYVLIKELMLSFFIAPRAIL